MRWTSSEYFKREEPMKRPRRLAQSQRSKGVARLDLLPAV